MKDLKHLRELLTEATNKRQANWRQEDAMKELLEEIPALLDRLDKLEAVVAVAKTIDECDYGNEPVAALWRALDALETK